MRAWIASVTTIVAFVGRAWGAVTVTVSTPYPGVTHVVRTDDAIPTVAHVLELDLSSAELRVITTSEGQRGATVSEWATTAGVSVAVNGDLFEPLSFAPAGLAFGGGAAWGISADTAEHGFIAFDRAMDLNHAVVSAPEEIVAAADLPAAVEGVVGGRPMLVANGVAASAFDCDDGLILACERAPRAAVGVSEDGRTLYLVVVDGWQASSLGMTAAEVATLLRDRGAHRALALDPGSSASMYVGAEGGLVSSPSDGVERDVANHVGVRYGALPPGTMLGFVRARDIFDSTANISGATVTLDDGRSTTTGADGRYTFTDLTPRYTCATASHPDYHSVTQCRDVPSAGMVFNSIALFPNSDFIDSGTVAIVDAAPPEPDAAARPDGSGAVDAAREDGGTGPGAPSACGCRAAGGARAPLVACLLLLGPAMLRRKRWTRADRPRPRTFTPTRPPARSTRVAIGSRWRRGPTRDARS